MRYVAAKWIQLVHDIVRCHMVFGGLHLLANVNIMVVKLLSTVDCCVHHNGILKLRHMHCYRKTDYCTRAKDIVVIICYAGQVFPEGHTVRHSAVQSLCCGDSKAMGLQCIFCCAQYGPWSCGVHATQCWSDIHVHTCWADSSQQVVSYFAFSGVFPSFNMALLLYDAVVTTCTLLFMIMIIYS